MGGDCQQSTYPTNPVLQLHLILSSARAASRDRRDDLIVSLAVRLLEMIAPEGIDAPADEEIEGQSRNTDFPDPFNQEIRE